MDGWFEVFRAGSYPQGDVSEADLDQVVGSYDPAWHEAPVVVGHPQVDAPAFGWVTKLQRRGKVLLARFSQVVPGLVKAVRDGRYKKVSIRLVKTKERGLYLWHVGFLGAQPPAVKGLAPIGFGEVEGGLDIEMDFTEAAWAAREGDEMTDAEKRAAALEQQLEQQKKDFAAQLEQQKKDFTAQIEQQQQDFLGKFVEERRARELTTLRHDVDGRVRDGKLAPALAGGLAEFMAALPDGDDQVLQFADADGKAQKKSPRAFFCDFLDQLPKSVELAAVAGSDSDPGAAAAQDFKHIDTSGGVTIDAAAAELDKKIRAYQEKHEGVSYADALTAVQG